MRRVPHCEKRWVSVPDSQVDRRTQMNRSRRSFLFLPLLTLAAFAGGVEAQANDLPGPGMLPDHPLYFLKSSAEGVRTFFTFGELARAERALSLAERRLSEADALMARGNPERAEDALDRYGEQLDRALGRAEAARANGDNTDDFSVRASTATLHHQAVLAEVHQRVPERARPGIERAMRAGKRGHEEALGALPDQRRDEVMREHRTRGRGPAPR
jgi:hypothetical protein